MREDAGPRAARLVGGFLAAGGAPDPAGASLAAAGITREEYVAVRGAALAWIEGRPVPDGTLAAALAARGGEVRAALSR